MEGYKVRTRLLTGEEGLTRLGGAHVLVAGAGGVGGSCLEALGRAGIGRITIIDFDVVDPSNSNRQVVALTSTIGQPKVEVMAERLRDINPNVELRLLRQRLSPSDAADVLEDGIDVVIDCIDALTSKVGLIKAAQERGIFVVSSMGAGGRLDPGKVKIAELYETHSCPMALAMRKLARKNGIQKGVRAVFSEERPMPHIPREFVPGAGVQKTINGTISYMPGTFGFFAASEAIRYLLGDVIPPESQRLVPRQPAETSR
jgi:tRNA A37 threonylcarbamoyladenosine dehydratase